LRNNFLFDSLTDARPAASCGASAFSIEGSIDISTVRTTSPNVDYLSYDWRFRQLLEALPAAIYTTDAQGRLTFYNAATVELAGREPELGRDRWCVSWRLYQADGSPMRHDECPMAIALKEDRPVRGVEAIIERPDGTRRHFMPFPTPLHDSSGTLIGGVNMLVDITERKSAEALQQHVNEILEEQVEERTCAMAEALAHLRASEERFRLLVQGVTDYAIFMLDTSGHVANWNLGAERIKGYQASEIIGRHFSQFYPQEDRQAGVPHRALETARRTGKFEAEGWRLRKDGTKFWASVVIDAIRDDAGELIGFAKITRDLTDKHAAEERLRQAERMEALGQLTGGVAHDFNNLLTAIMGNLELLATVLPEDGSASRYAQSALRAASRGAQLTEQLLAFSRRQEIRPRSVAISDSLSQILMLCHQIVGERIEIELQVRPDIWNSHIDLAQFETAILNLAANARDAMDWSGRLTISGENLTIGDEDGLDLPAGDYVVVSVGDNGCGMSADVLARAFEPFYTTKEVGKGTGLGLSQVYGFAKQSGGTVRIESREGSGTTVRIYLPRSDGATIEPEVDRYAAAPAPNATVLVVEDDADVREMLIEMLSDLGYQTSVAESGAQALALLRQHPDIDLLFTDVVMPAGMSGTDLARTVRRLHPKVKILLTSGYAGIEPQATAARREFPFITKPYRAAALGKKITEVLAGQLPVRLPA
jgi:PAS domain S-box-containing protein